MTILADHQIHALCENPLAIWEVYENVGHAPTTSYGFGVPSGEPIQIRHEIPIYFPEDKCFSRSQHIENEVKKKREWFEQNHRELAGSGFVRLQNPSQQMREDAMISPFVPYQVRTRTVVDKHATDGIENDTYREEKILSYGTSSFGYDLRLGHKFKVFTNMNATVVDPKNFDNKSFVDVTVPEIGGEIIIPPNSFILGYSLDYVRMPDNVLAEITGKSTIARMGIICIATPLEPGWEGHVTLEFANSTPLPAKLYVGEGCCQAIFHKGERPRVTYGDRGGKYQKQEADAVVPRV